MYFEFYFVGHHCCRAECARAVDLVLVSRMHLAGFARLYGSHDVDVIAGRGPEVLQALFDSYQEVSRCVIRLLSFTCECSNRLALLTCPFTSDFAEESIAHYRTRLERILLDYSRLVRHAKQGVLVL